MIDVLINLKLVFFIFFLIVFFSLEFFFSQRNTEKKFTRLFFHSCFAVFNTIIMRIPTIFLLLPILLITNDNNYGLLNMMEFNFLIKAILAIILLDFAFYWFHRLNHMNNFLWRFHKVHHLDTQMDVTTSLRFHIGELIISSIYKSILIIFLGVPMSVFIFYEIILSLSAQFHHADLKLPESIDRQLSKIIVTPKYHTNHHTVAIVSRNANFASILTIWDYLFFSLKAADNEERRYLGVKERDKQFGFIINLKEPFINN